MTRECDAQTGRAGNTDELGDHDASRKAAMELRKLCVETNRELGARGEHQRVAGAPFGEGAWLGERVKKLRTQTQEQGASCSRVERHGSCAHREPSWSEQGGALASKEASRARLDAGEPTRRGARCWQGAVQEHGAYTGWRARGGDRALAEKLRPWASCSARSRERSAERSSKGLAGMRQVNSGRACLILYST